MTFYDKCLNFGFVVKKQKIPLVNIQTYMPKVTNWLFINDIHLFTYACIRLSIYVSACLSVCCP